MARDRVTVAHFPGTLLPSWLPCAAVTTFYDLAALHYPELYDPAELRHERLDGHVVIAVADLPVKRILPQQQQRQALAGAELRDQLGQHRLDNAP